MTLDMTKPHKGTIHKWHKTLAFKGLLYAVGGVSEGHSDFDGGPIFTSYVVKCEGNEIETRNTRYTLGSPRDE